VSWLKNPYDLLRGLHIIAVMAWMAGQLYLPRLYVYHSKAAVGSEMDETFKVMEAKLLRIIMNPAMIAAWVFGGALIWYDGAHRLGWSFLATPWMLTKLAGILFMTSWHGYLASARKAFAAGRRVRSERFWRMSNELPFIVLIVMVLAVTTEFVF
jgi:putative membrane protein